MRTSKWELELDAIKTMGLEGKNMKNIAEHYGVSRQRMKQLILRYIPDWKENYGYAVVRRERAQEYQDKWGSREDTDLYKAQRHKFFRKKANAKSVGWPWDVKFGDLDWPTHCPILGIELDYFAETRQENSPSFDQVDPGKGYVTGNVRIMSWRANRIKNDGTAEEHRKVAEYLESL